jgi:spore germination protein GerM
MMKHRFMRMIPGIILTAVLFAGCAAPKDNPVAEQVDVRVYFGSHDAEHIVAEKYKVKNDALLMQRSMEILIGGPRNPDLLAVVPPAAKVKSVLVKDGIAYVDFSDEMLTHRFGGSSREILAVAAIVDTLTEFPAVDGVQILVEGKKVSTLFGHMDVSGPLGRSPGIIIEK